jgi:isoleucyl-tRNA synthetase
VHCRTGKAIIESMGKKYREFAGLDLPAIENEVSARWEAENAFGESIAVRKGAPSFVFYEGPPSANGLLPPNSSNSSTR